MTTLHGLRIHARLALAAGTLFFSSACASDDPADDAADDGSDGEAPKYAVMYEIYDDTGSNSYLALLDSLDDEIDPATSREFAGGRAFLRVYNGWIFVGDAASPVVTRFSLGDDGSLVEDGTISFANYGLLAGSIDTWQQVFISPTKSYLLDMASGVHVIWNPTTMEILGEIEPPAEFFRDGYSLETNPPALRGNKLYRSIHWANYTTVEYSQEQLLAVYDVETDELISTTVETRCPNPGNRSFVDESGTIYFSNWIWPIAGTLMHDRAANCVLRIPAGSDSFDPDWSIDYTEVSGGDHGGMFTYTGDGNGLVAIFDDSLTMFDDTTDPWAYAGSPVWSVWQVDVETGVGAPVDGIPLSAGAYTPLLIDGRTFVMLPNSTYSETQLYEIEGTSGTPGLVVPGWSYMFEKIE